MAGLCDVGAHSEPALLVLVTALWGEAKCVINKFDLSPHRPVPGITLYGNANILVGICGKGPENANRYCQNLARWLEQGGRANSTVWVNYGSAGSVEHALGTLVQAVHITTAQGEDMRQFSTTDLPGVRGVGVRTHEFPDSGYAPGMVHDMEAAGFEAGVGSVLDNPKMYIVKLVCDSPEQPWHETDKHRYQALLDAASEKLLRLLDIIRRENS